MSLQYEERPPDGPTQWVYYEGTDTLRTGYGLCYNSDYGTAATATPARLYRVEKASVDNYRFFAGVVHPAFDGVTGPARIRILRPGAHAYIWAYASGTVGATRHTLVVGQYYFKDAGLSGAGTATCLQTVDRSSTAGTMYAVLDAGPQSGLVQYVSTATACTVGGVTVLRKGSGADIAPTLADGAAFGDLKLLTCQLCTENAANVTVAHHALGDDTVFIHDAVGEYTLLMWNGIQWETIAKTSTHPS